MNPAHGQNTIPAHLPPLDALYVFVVAARHLSFTAAAEELHRTQSAVSHRIKALEADIGVRLFARDARGLKLTVEGDVLAAQLSRAIADMARAISEVNHVGTPRPLRVTMLPSVASRWLMPRLPRFCEAHPELQVQVIADPTVVDLRAEDVDLAIRFGRGEYRDHVATFLMRDRVLPVCSPRLLSVHGNVTTLDELLKRPLLHDSSTEGDGSLSDWRSWLHALGRSDLSCRAGQRFSHAGLAIEAAVGGMGVALARFSLVADDLARGMLVSPLPITTETAFSYYLVSLPEKASAHNVLLFSQWLQLEAQNMHHPDVPDEPSLSVS